MGISKFQIVCINKDGGNHDNPYEAIWNFGWLNAATGERGRADLSGMVKFVEEGGYAYTRDVLGREAHLVVRVSARGNKYVQTEANGKPTDNLLSLTECQLR